MLSRLFDSSVRTSLLGLFLAGACANCSFAQDTPTKVDPGQADLDAAVVERIGADSQAELDKVSKLLQSALKKGLADENETLAKKMLGSVQLQRAQKLTEDMARARARNQQMQLRADALQILERAVKNDPELVEAYTLIARLNMLPGGDREAIQKATTKAIELLTNEPVEQSAAYVLRALSYDQDENEKRMADLDAAVKADKENIQALQARAALRLNQGDVDGAIADLEGILSQDPTNQAVAQTAVQQLVELNRVEEALELMTKTLKAKPSEGMYRMRAILYRMQGKEDEAWADLNKALAIQPRDPISLLQRAEIALQREDVKSAKEDLNSATKLAPQIMNSDQALFVRCLIAIEEERMADAINDMKQLVSRDPTNIVRAIQLANLYVSDERPRKAIETLASILDRDPTNITVLRARGDAYLAIGDHGAAIKDYERALDVFNEDGTPKSADDLDGRELPGILNNLAWVLATSPNDKVRNGKRAVELGERAVKLTDGKEAHILSTLAAGYAEAGNFEKAIEWSTKSVELGKSEEPVHDQLEQLQKELKSYQEGKPWREKQETEENAIPILSPDDLIDT